MLIQIESISSPGNKYCLMDKNVNKGSSNLTQWGHVNPNPPWGKPRFRVKSKMAAIKPVICVFFLINRYNLRTKQRTATYNMSSRTNF